MCLFCAGPGESGLMRLLYVARPRMREGEAQALCPSTLFAHRDGI